ncbi:hypothetical protein AWL63_06095 [Sphingomonas panacis]|uniref:Uncharacterized protein n=1 Tax=Sphingomonas panacis TaxID=1560345 RepID=A0A1B3Z844_9SPHN|nr:hypothetical protein [Sphingomonas panacis]AOH83606.1 hypothetical protein AWL63_06095 [Sphingomonas panacis]
MRQVRHDELLYHLFDATRGWAPALRNGLALDAERRARWIEIGASVIAERMRRFYFFPDGEPAPLNGKELAAVVAKSIDGWRHTLRLDFTSREEKVRRQARWTAAYLLAEDFAGYQILSELPDPPPFRLCGEAGSGVPPRDQFPDPIGPLFG